MQVNKLHLNCGTEGGYPGGIQRVKIEDFRACKYPHPLSTFEPTFMNDHDSAMHGCPSITTASSSEVLMVST